MKLEWIDDLLAVIDAGSLSNAAQRRLITQPAFSRRLRAIEKNLDIVLIDRARKPVQAQPSLIALESRLREASQLLHKLKRDLSAADNVHGELVLVGQHAISTTMAPTLVRALGGHSDMHIRLRSANREECLSLLLTRQADIALLYQLDGEQWSPREQFIDSYPLMQELLIPVIASEQRAGFEQDWRAGSVRIITYPRSVFLGDVLHGKVLPQLDDSMEMRWVAETALTSAAVQLALAGNGIAWVPLSLASSAIKRGELFRLDEQLPVMSLSIVAFKLVQQDKPLVVSAWDRIVSADWLDFSPAGVSDTNTAA